MEMVVSQAIQVANCQLVAIRETHGYLKRKAAEYGIILTEQDLHSWSMSAWMELAKAKAWLRMPATRFEKRSEKEKKPKTEVFPHSEELANPIGDAELPFSNPAMASALRKLRAMLRRDSVNESELIAILRESSPDQTLLLSNFEEIQARTAELCLQRWPVILELVQSMRNEDGGEAA
jgi:hypothetical protein